MAFGVCLQSCDEARGRQNLQASRRKASSDTIQQKPLREGTMYLSHFHITAISSSSISMPRTVEKVLQYMYNANRTFNFDDLVRENLIEL
jgi:hypothetical protein